MPNPTAMPPAPVKLMGVGAAGAGKTMSTVALARAGFKIRLLDFDGNAVKVYQQLARGESLDVDVRQCYDEWTHRKEGNRIVSRPRGDFVHAFEDAMTMIEVRWKYKADGGEEIDLGSPREWGTDHVLIIDPFSRLTERALDAAKQKSGRLLKRTSLPDRGQANELLERLLANLKSPRYGCNIIVNTHLKLIEPILPSGEELEKALEDSEELRKMLARFQLESALKVPSQLLPEALGRALPRQTPTIFDTVVGFKFDPKLDKRQILVAPTAEMEWIKVPLHSADRFKGKALDVDTGMLTLFKKLGVEPPSQEPEGEAK